MPQKAVLCCNFKRMNQFMRRLLAPVLGLGFLLLILHSCTHEPSKNAVTGSGYPDAVAKIIVTRCATAGCHNALSYENASALRMDQWDRLFDGSSHGAVVIPYDIENSSLLYFINTDHSLGHEEVPTMPLNATPLTKEEYLTIRDWIAAGAPDKDGNIPFASDAATRQKIYMTMQGCDLLTVVDADRKVIMRNIQIGKELNSESPHCVRVSKDGNFAYVCFIAGDYVQKIDTRTDAIVAEKQISTNHSASWNILHLSDDGTKMMIADFINGRLKILNTGTMEEINTIYAPGLFSSPHGIESNIAFDTFYVTAQYGNFVYKVLLDGTTRRIRIDSNVLSNNHGLRDPHEILMTPDHSKYFLTCEASGEVRVMDVRGDTVSKVFSTPGKPQEMALSTVKPYLFVTCMEDASNPLPGAKGSVVVINYQTMEIVKTIYGDFYQPHGITVDDARNHFFISSANVDPTGPAPHHVSTCGGRNGWYTIYDINTLEAVNGIRYETSVYPYSVDARFKNH